MQAAKERHRLKFERFQKNTFFSI